MASLCHMLTDYYSRLKREHGSQPSTRMLASIAQGLHLPFAERDHLFRLAGHNPPTQGMASEHISPGMLRVFDRLHGTPAEVVAALPHTVALLIVGRTLQGASMGVIPLGISLLRDTVPAERLGFAVALVSATMGVGGALGMPLSAFVTEHADWHALFWVAAAMGTVCFALVIVLVPTSTPRYPGRIDLIAVASLTVGLTGVLLVISRGNEWDGVRRPHSACAPADRWSTCAPRRALPFC